MHYDIFQIVVRDQQCFHICHFTLRSVWVYGLVGKKKRTSVNENKTRRRKRKSVGKQSYFQAKIKTRKENKQT